MAIINTKAIATVATYPAMVVVRRETNKGTYVGGKYNPDIEFTDIVKRESLCVAYESRNHGTMYNQHTANSVISYAIESNKCPIEALDRCRANKHETHWLNESATCLHNGPKVQETWTLLNDGMIVRFEGQLFVIKVHHDRAQLVPAVFAEV